MYIVFFVRPKANLYLIVIICERVSGVQTKTDCGQLKFVCDLQLSEIQLQCCTSKTKRRPGSRWPRLQTGVGAINRLSVVEFNFHLLLTRKGFSPSFLVFPPRKCQCYHISPSNNSLLLYEKPTFPNRNSILQKKKKKNLPSYLMVCAFLFKI